MRLNLQQRHVALPLTLAALASVLVAFATTSRAQTATATAADMKAYVETIPGSDLKFEMIPIPGGKFTMGSLAGETKRSDEEGPQHEVQIAPFWMGKCEVTWNEYDLFAFSLDLKKKAENGADPAKKSVNGVLVDAVTRPTPPYADPTFGMGHDGQPAICITHHAAMEYCRWLSNKTGKAYRLPTEAEWEYACRAGTKTTYFFGDDPKKLGEYAWFVDNAEKPQLIGKKKPNPWGLYDMHGNVSEWCLDHYVKDEYGKFKPGVTAISPVELPDAKEYPYVARGGSWDDDADKLRSAMRLSSTPEWSVQDPQRPQSIWWHTDATFVGFRLVRALDEQENLRGIKSQVVKGKGTR